MNVGFLSVITSWSAYLSAIATILTFATGILFFTVKGPFGKINDISSIFQVLFMIPLALSLYRPLPASMRTLGLIPALIGIGGMLVAAYGQSLLVFGKIDFEESMKYFPAGAAIGIWLIVTCSLALAYHLFPTGLSWIGILAGTSYIAIVLAFLIKGQQNMVFYIGGLVLGISYPIWALWLGHLIVSAMDAIITIDSQQRIILFNEATEQMFRCSAAEVLGQPLDRFIPVQFREAYREHVHNFGKTNRPNHSMGNMELTCLRADGEEFPAEINISQVEMAG